MSKFTVRIKFQTRDTDGRACKLVLTHANLKCEKARGILVSASLASRNQAPSPSSSFLFPSSRSVCFEADQQHSD